MIALELLQATMERVTADYDVSIYGQIYGTGTVQLTIKGDDANVTRFFEGIAYPQMLVIREDEEQ